MWAGRPWPLNTAALNTASQGQVETISPHVEVQPKNDYLLYALYASGKSWQSAAAKRFMKKFALAFDLSRKNCTTSSMLEPSYGKLCMMDETSSPGDSDPMTTAYGAIFVPASNVSKVLPWALLHR